MQRRPIASPRKNDSDSMVAPCGCLMRREGNVFELDPCSGKCGVNKYVLEKSRARGDSIVKVKGKVIQ